MQLPSTLLYNFMACPETILPLLLHLHCSIMGTLDSATEDAGGFFL